MAAPAKQKTNTIVSLHTKSKKKRPRIHSKKTTSHSKTSKNYRKLSRGQGK